MFQIEAELRSLVEQLQASEIPYALCGALALGLYAQPRATLDIDLLALAGSAPNILRTARALGFELPAAPMGFANGKVQIDRITKVTTGSKDFLMLDVLTVSAEIEDEIVVNRADWLGTELRVVSRASLVLLKRLRSSPQDLVDIEKLES